MSHKKLDLSAFKIPLGKLAPRQNFKTRQGDTLSYRLYPAWSEDLVVLFHGVGADSRYMCVLASAMAESGFGTVVTPDFRCHGVSLEMSDRVSFRQLEIDLEELLIHLKMSRGISRVILAGHSLGGGFVLRLAVSDLRRQFVKFIAFAPYLPPVLNAYHPNWGGWIEVLENGFKVNMPEIFKSGQEKLEYSSEFLKSVSAPDDLVFLLKKFNPPVHVLTGEEDEVIAVEKQKEIFSLAGVAFDSIPDFNHLSVVSQPKKILDLL